MKKLFLLFGIIVLVSCGTKNETKILQGEVFGSYYAIKYFGNQDLKAQVDSIFTSVDKSLSTYRKDSEISIWNAGNDSIKLSKDFLNNAKLAAKVHTLSDGYYDPTVKTLVEGWGFGNGKPNNKLSDKEVVELLKNVGFDKLNLSPSNQNIYKENKNIQLDFNSITPGYVADKIAELFKQNGINNFIIDIGGEISANGINKDSSESWTVGIENPIQVNDTDRKVYHSFELKNAALATSGNYRKTKTDSLGNTFVHTINPKSGYTVPSNLVSVTIITHKAANADAYATACMAMGLEKSIAFLQKENIQAFLLYVENKTLMEKKLNGFP